ncbi:hypothetical protein AGMMS49531_08880 [Endomicrobiia bacterium]|nr:hypothetical protein AGMMS49531_08880 [Endomicrobiia bacterium]
MDDANESHFLRSTSTIAEATFVRSKFNFDKWVPDQAGWK